MTCGITALRSYNDLQTIAELNRKLEYEVEERTRQLEKAHKKLTESVKLSKKNRKDSKKK